METIFFDSLSDADEEPYYSLEEWETILELYIIFLVDNRDHIFEAGYPQNNFNQCPWLDLGYSNFYPTVCSLDFLSRWNDLEDDMPSNLGTKKVRLLSSKNAKIVENDRSTLYDLKILILYTLLAAVTRKNDSHVLVICLNFVKEGLFKGEKYKYYSEIDKTYLEDSITMKELNFPLEKPDPGGLTSILDLISHFSQELEFGLRRRIRKHLEEIVLMDKTGCQQFKIESYFQLIGRKEEKCCFDKAFSLWLSQIDVEDTIANYYQKKIDSYFIDDEYQSSQVELFKKSKKYCFSKHDALWTINYKKRETTVKHLKGMYYIAYLLLNPGKEVHVIALDVFAHQETLFPTQKDFIKQNMGEERLFEDTAKTEDLISNKTIKDVKKRIKLLEKSNNNSKGLKYLKKYLKDALGFRKEPKKFQDAEERSRKAVKKCIDKAIDSFEKPLYALYRHLSNSIKYKTYHCSYCPDRPIRWVVRFNRNH